MLKILTIGDSITDAGRTAAEEPDLSLGGGYPLYLNAMIGANYPGLSYEFYNRGISGNRVKDLKARWDKDCLSLKPDILTILIGINDTWRRYDENDPTTVEKFAETYREILSEVKKELPDTKIIIMEPFLLPKPEDKQEWRVDLDPKIHAVRKLAKEFADDFIPLDGLLAQAAILGKSEQFSADGVHPLSKGHMLIAQQLFASLENFI